MIALVPKYRLLYIAQNVASDRESLFGLCHIFCVKDTQQNARNIKIFCSLLSERLRGITGSALDHRSLPREFEFRCWYI